MPLDKLCIVFIFFALQCGGILRSGIEDAYQFKMSHREIRQYDKRALCGIAYCCLTAI